MHFDLSHRLGIQYTLMYSLSYGLFFCHSLTHVHVINFKPTIFQSYIKSIFSRSTLKIVLRNCSMPCVKCQFICSLFALTLFQHFVQESSFKCGLAYIVAVIAEFDEYTNDMIYLREGTCLPRCV